MEKIPTAEEWLTSFGADADDMFYKHSVEEAMIEFAKLHVEAALKAASEKVKLSDDVCEVLQEHWTEDNIKFIKNSYPLENIK
jgi:hypothetical protein